MRKEISFETTKEYFLLEDAVLEQEKWCPWSLYRTIARFFYKLMIAHLTPKCYRIAPLKINYSE